MGFEDLYEEEVVVMGYKEAVAGAVAPGLAVPVVVLPVANTAGIALFAVGPVLLAVALAQPVALVVAETDRTVAVATVDQPAQTVAFAVTSAVLFLVAVAAALLFADTLVERKSLVVGVGEADEAVAAVAAVAQRKGGLVVEAENDEIVAAAAAAAAAVQRKKGLVVEAEKGHDPLCRRRKTSTKTVE
ncbi:hypothetical protein EPUS_03293 [Endocarpon pusillum Z07020]|uniref:Uncharacterized protein n=1 Tax=Endocarpon pusillum (strain Z07020 / HMAS-L-300199) TaxID=1263415 RepID=U1GFW8_ENDPU|nr:uncharacterized protein EPUS_03293 [Endocarpon pusillum Z07020]ERF71013.1 hypothetical protein EPUS_03293 [Endocarpon pusillum Z07020]